LRHRPAPPPGHPTAGYSMGGRVGERAGAATIRKSALGGISDQILTPPAWKGASSNAPHQPKLSETRADTAAWPSCCSAPASPVRLNRSEPPPARTRPTQPLLRLSAWSVNGSPSSKCAIVSPIDPPTISRRPPSSSTRNQPSAASLLPRL